MKNTLIALTAGLLLVACQPALETQSTPTDSSDLPVQAQPESGQEDSETNDLFFTFTSENTGYTVEYPTGWIAETFEGGAEESYLVERAVFAPENLGYDYIWSIAALDPSKLALGKDALIDKEIANAGDQWGADRQENRENISVNGVDALKVTVTNGQGWEQILVFILSDKYIYEISNGATDDYDFDSFYQSFKLL